MALGDLNNMKKFILFVAHPDDETLFFSGPLKTNGSDFHVVLVTDGNADKKGPERLKEFSKVLEFFKVDSFETYLFTDIYDKEIDQKELKLKIKNTLMINAGKDSIIFTHGPFGEYGHPHHIQVSQAVHEIALADFQIHHPNILELENSSYIYEEEDIYKAKLEILTTTYREEFSRFVTLLAPKRVERFLESNSSTLKIAQFLNEDKKNLPNDWGGYEIFKESLLLFKTQGLARRF